MTTKEYLNQYRRIITKIRLIEMDIESLEAGIGAAPQPRDEGVPFTPSTRNTTEDTLVALVDMKHDKEALLLESKAKAAEISEIIERLADIKDPNAAVYMQLLYDRYILLMSWSQVAKDINFTEQYSRGALHGKALLAISELL
ncbi:MAG: hypothetical protein IJY32_01770 [Mogibacterium sp.]|nr:hypothetical protein [Mogibacterium sp.]